MGIRPLLTVFCVESAMLLASAVVHATPQGEPMSQGKPSRNEFRPNSPVVTVRPTVVTLVHSGSGRKSRVAIKKGQRLTFYSLQMTFDSIVLLPDGRKGFVHTRDIRQIRL